MELYVIRSEPGASSYGLMATDDEHCFVYSPNTGLWHRSHECEIDFVFDRESVYEKVDAVTAERLRQKIRRLDGRTMRWYLRKLEEQAPKWKRTSAEVGLLTDTQRTRPITAKVAALMRARPKKQWTEVVNVPAADRVRARKLVAELQSRPRQVFKVPVESRMTEKGKVFTVGVRPRQEEAVS